jgi:hypothetical protein
MGPAIAAERRRGCLIGRHRGYRRLWCSAVCVFVVAVTGQRDDDEKWNDPAKQAPLFFFMAAGGGRAYSARGGTVRAEQVSRALLAGIVGLDFECQSLADSRTTSILRKFRYMHEDFRTAIGGSDESKATIIVPFSEGAFDAHGIELMVL